MRESQTAKTFLKLIFVFLFGFMGLQFAFAIPPINFVVPQDISLPVPSPLPTLPTLPELPPLPVPLAPDDCCLPECCTSNCSSTTPPVIGGGGGGGGVVTPTPVGTGTIVGTVVQPGGGGGGGPITTSSGGGGVPGSVVPTGGGDLPITSFGFPTGNSPEEIPYGIGGGEEPEMPNTGLGDDKNIFYLLFFLLIAIFELPILINAKLFKTV
jgi:hypothetical protein